MDIEVPKNAESVTEATVGKWLKNEGDPVGVDEIIVEVETDKATVEVRSSVEGILEKIHVPTGTTVKTGTVLGKVQEKKGAASAATKVNRELPVSAPVPPLPPVAPNVNTTLSPAVRQLVADNNLDPETIKGTGKGGRTTKEDVLQVLSSQQQAALPPSVSTSSGGASQSIAPQQRELSSRGQRRVQMTQLRKTIATRLKQSQNTAAMLTTFNEVDMSAVMTARTQYKDLFEKKYAVRLGFMSFFAKACVAALQEIPAVNAQVDGDDIVYNDAVHMGIAVGTPRGLVVPVLRDIDQMTFADIEKKIGYFGLLARDGKLSLEDMRGGTFTISNGGVYGSMLSTPILNPPQSGILGMHKIQDRAVVVNGQIVIRPIMFLAFTYDHRIVDGKEAVTFLVLVKNYLEEPERLILGV